MPARGMASQGKQCGCFAWTLAGVGCVHTAAPAWSVGKIGWQIGSLVDPAAGCNDFTCSVVQQEMHNVLQFTIS